MIQRGFLCQHVSRPRFSAPLALVHLEPCWRTTEGWGRVGFWRTTEGWERVGFWRTIEVEGRVGFWHTRVGFWQNGGVGKWKGGKLTWYHEFYEVPFVKYREVKIIFFVGKWRQSALDSALIIMSVWASGSCIECKCLCILPRNTHFTNGAPYIIRSSKV